MFNIEFILTYAIIVGIVLLFGYFLYKEFSHTRAIISELNSLSSFVQTIHSDKSVDFQNLLSHEQQWLLENIVCDYSSDDVIPVKESHRFLAKGPIGSLIPEFTDGKYKSIPALLTSIGITGTFLGITIGLSQFDSTAFDSKSLLVSAASLLEGMKTAFYTSLAGLSLSATFMVLLNKTTNDIQIAKKHLTQALSIAVIEVSAVSYLRNLSSATDNQQELLDAQLKSTASMEALGLGFSDIAEHLKSSHLDPNELSNTLATSVSKALMKGLEPTNETLRSTSDTIADNSTIMMSNFELLTQELNNMTKSLSSDELSKVMSTAMKSELTPISEQFKASSESIDTNTSKMANNFDVLTHKFADVAESLDGDKLADSVSSSITHVMKEQLTPVLESISTEIGQLKEIKKQNQQELAELLINKMRDDLITPVTAELQRTADAVSASNTVTDQLNKNVESVLTSLSDSISTINTFQEDTMQKLQGFALSLTEILETFKTDTQSAMSEITIGVKEALEYSVDGMKQQRKAFDESAEKASNSFKDMEYSLSNALDDRQKMERQLFDNVELRMNTMLTSSNEVFTNQTQSLTEAGNAASKLMDDARTHLVSGLGDIDNKINSMSNAVQVELESFRKQYQTNLNEFFEQQNHSLEETLGKQADKLSNVVGLFKDTFESEYKTRSGLLESLTAQHQELQKSAATIEKMAKAVGLHEAAKMSELQDTAATIGKQVGHLKKEYAQANIAFKEVTEGMPKAMTDYFERANASFETFFNDFDTSASAIHNRLAQAADYLIEAKMQERELDRSGIV